ncbi:MAG: DUF1624 domain-containing protein [Bacteroidales bacterium]|nr:DUF1624 domain-containing protein [Bacteroidales bacterium]
MKNQRLLSLDAFRGFTIAAMIMVNNPGSWSHIYPPLEHAPWNGLTPTDLIFPFFLFMIGISVVLAYSKLLEKNTPRRKLYLKILSRTLKIFIVGVALNFIQHFDFSAIRYAGVLQRIAIVFLFASILFLHSGWKLQLYLGAGILVVYWLAMILIPTPGFDRPMLEPGANLAAWVDSRFLPGVLWQGSWDPEGILSTFPALVTCIMGMLTGHLIRSELSEDRKVIWMFLLGSAAAICGYMWSWFFPMNKNLWTSSFVLVSGGIAMIVLAASIFRVDMMKKEGISRLGIIFGSNAITIYVLADLIRWPFYGMSIGGASLAEHFVGLSETTGVVPEMLSMLYSVLYLAILFLPAWWLYHKRIFIKL